MCGGAGGRGGGVRGVNHTRTNARTGTMAARVPLTSAHHRPLSLRKSLLKSRKLSPWRCAHRTSSALGYAGCLRGPPLHRSHGGGSSPLSLCLRQQTPRGVMGQQTQPHCRRMDQMLAQRPNTRLFSGQATLTARQARKAAAGAGLVLVNEPGFRISQRDGERPVVDGQRDWLVLPCRVLSGRAGV